MRKSFQSYRYTEAGDISDTDLLDGVDKGKHREERKKIRKNKEGRKKER